MIKFSRQREGILKFLDGRTDHPTAETIFEGVRREMPNISLGTVYRNLTQLSDMGRIRRLSGDGKCDRFDPNISPHYHFICDTCGSVEDIPMTSMDSLNQLAQAYLGGKVLSHSLLFHGVCSGCLQKAEEGAECSVRLPEDSPDSCGEAENP